MTVVRVPDRRSLEQHLIALAAKRMGIAIGQVAYLFSHAMATPNTGWSVAAGGSAGSGRSATNGHTGGVDRLFTTANGADGYRQTGNAGPNTFATARPFYIDAYVQFTGAINSAAHHLLGFGEGNGTNGIFIGISGQASTTKLAVAKHDGSSYTNVVLSEDATLSAWTRLRLYRHTNGNIFARVNSGAEQSVSATGLHATAEALCQRVINNGGDATARQLLIDYSFFAAKAASA